MLPNTIQEMRRDLRLFDTTSRPTSLVAIMDSHNKEMRVLNAEAFIAFVRKSFINLNAEDDPEVYPFVNEREVAAAVCKYLDAGVSLNFRYSRKIPNQVRKKIRAMHIPQPEGEDREKELAVQSMMEESQPETFMWFGHGRALIRDYLSFVEAFTDKTDKSDKMAIAMLVEMAKKVPLLIVRDYIGTELFLVDGDKKAVQNLSFRVTDDRLRTILEEVKSTLAKEGIYDKPKVDP